MSPSLVCHQLLFERDHVDAPFNIHARAWLFRVSDGWVQTWNLNQNTNKALHQCQLSLMFLCLHCGRWSDPSLKACQCCRKRSASLPSRFMRFVHQCKCLSSEAVRNGDQSKALTWILNTEYLPWAHTEAILFFPRMCLILWLLNSWGPSVACVPLHCCRFRQYSKLPVSIVAKDFLHWEMSIRSVGDDTLMHWMLTAGLLVLHAQQWI